MTIFLRHSRTEGVLLGHAPGGNHTKSKYSMSSHVYIMTNRPNGVLYIGVTSNLKRRIAEHKESLIPGFTQKYNIRMLVYFEQYEDIRDAITREKQLKKWNRSWKIRLIEKMNPQWNDLFSDL